MIIAGIHQPNFLPWPGYFHKMMQCDVFVILDDVAVARAGVSTRNIITGKNHFDVMLHIPLKKSLHSEMIYSSAFADDTQRWHQKLLNKITDAYRQQPHFGLIFPVLERIFEKNNRTLLDYNLDFIKEIAGLLAIKTKMVLSSTLPVGQYTRNERNIAICREMHADVYLSGTGAEKYNEPGMFQQNQIRLIYQHFPGFELSTINRNIVHKKSILDPLFIIGPSETQRILESQKMTINSSS